MAYKQPPKEHQFTSENQPKKRGRRKSLLKHYITETGVSKQDVEALFKSVLLNHTQPQLEEMLKDRERPMIVRVLIRAFLEDFRSGSISNIEKILTRAYGAPFQKQEHEITGANGGPLRYEVVFGNADDSDS